MPRKFRKKTPLYLERLEDRLAMASGAIADSLAYQEWRAQTFSLDALQYSLESSVLERPQAAMAGVAELVGLNQAFQTYPYRGNGYSVAVIDTGVDYNHPALGGGWGSKVIGGWDFVGRDSNPMDENGHGTHIAGIVAGSAAGFQGMAPGASIIALRVLDAEGGGSFGDVEDALRWVSDHQPEFNIVAVNLSLGAGNYDSNPYTFLEDELASLQTKGVLVAASAGNSFFTYDSEPGLGYPAISSSVVSVGAVWDGSFGSVSWSSGARDYSTAADRVTSFSQRSGVLDLVAPGAIIRSTYLDGGYESLAGTSMASPIVAGATVLIHQALDLTGQAGRANQTEILNIFRNTGVIIGDGDDEQDNVINTGLSFPRIDVMAALRSIDNLNPNPLGGSPVGPAVLATGAGAGGGPHVRLFAPSSTGGLAEVHGFFAYIPGFQGGVRVALGDVNGDGRPEVFTAPGPGFVPKIKIWDVSTGSARKLGHFFAYDPAFMGGVTIAVSDIDADGKVELVTGAGPGGGPHVRVWTISPTGAAAEMAGFFAYDPAFAGGVYVAGGDVDGNGRSDVIVGAGPGGYANVATFRVNRRLQVHAISSYLIEPLTFTGGASVAAADINADGRVEIITGIGPGGQPIVRINDGLTGALAVAYVALEPTDAGGVHVAAADVNGDGVAELVASRRTGLGPLVRAFSMTNHSEVISFNAYAAMFAGGVFVGGASSARLGGSATVHVEANRLSRASTERPALIDAALSLLPYRHAKIALEARAPESNFDRFDLSEASIAETWLGRDAVHKTEMTPLRRRSLPASQADLNPSLALRARN